MDLSCLEFVFILVQERENFILLLCFREFCICKRNESVFAVASGGLTVAVVAVGNHYDLTQPLNGLWHEVFTVCK